MWSSHVPPAAATGTAPRNRRTAPGVWVSPRPIRRARRGNGADARPDRDAGPAGRRHEVGTRRKRRTKMLGLKRLKVAQYERALVFRERSLERVLTPGVYWLWDPLKRLAVQVYDVNTPEADPAARRRAGQRVARACSSRTWKSSSSAIARWAWSTRTSAWRRAGAGYAPAVLARSGEGARRSARHQRGIHAGCAYRACAGGREGRERRGCRDQRGRSAGYGHRSADRRRRAARGAEAGSLGLLEVPARTCASSWWICACRPWKWRVRKS